MKKLGMVGGVSWLSTIEYYRTICEMAHRDWLGDPEAGASGPPSVPEMVIESLDIHRSFGLRGTVGDKASWEGYDRYFREALKRLERAGAQVALIASNTPHNRLASITEGVLLPVIDMFEVTADECAAQVASRVLILGTLPTMRSSTSRACAT